VNGCFAQRRKGKLKAQRVDSFLADATTSEYLSFNPQSEIRILKSARPLAAGDTDFVSQSIFSPFNFPIIGGTVTA
jgi:hypothetical protein